jgi:hypothetical protein
MILFLTKKCTICLASRVSIERAFLTLKNDHMVRQSIPDSPLYREGSFWSARALGYTLWIVEVVTLGCGSFAVSS